MISELSNVISDRPRRTAHKKGRHRATRMLLVVQVNRYSHFITVSRGGMPRRRVRSDYRASLFYFHSSSPVVTLLLHPEALAGVSSRIQDASSRRSSIEEIPESSSSDIFSPSVSLLNRLCCSRSQWYREGMRSSRRTISPDLLKTEFIDDNRGHKLEVTELHFEEVENGEPITITPRLSPQQNQP